MCVSRDHLKLEQNSLGRKEKKQNRKFTIAYCDKPTRLLNNNNKRKIVTTK